ncbi:PGF-CTERM sorting domain-containing protein [Salinigranum marinum]|uniref:PGF-CTERM sorting domain-containing protein n=1 Tax=Salinigranum marinum TaxID=1515595 RepID=UPI00298A0586|nr:PGF-CTERM sorting domain-containing protein [Salinigranum marinum]
MNGRSLVALCLVLCTLTGTVTAPVGALETAHAPPVPSDTERTTLAHGTTWPVGTAASTRAAGVGAADRNVSLTTPGPNVSLTATGATNGTVSEYELSSLDGVGNLSIEVTGVATTEVDTVSTPLTPGAIWDLRIAGDVEPAGPDGTGNPEVSLTARQGSWNTGYASNDLPNGTLFGDDTHSAHTIRSVPANVELHRLTIPELSSVDGGCADVYVNEDGQNGAYSEGIQVASGLCPTGTGSTTIQFDTPYTTTSDGVTVEFVSTIGGPVRAPLDETAADRDGYENSERGDAGDFVANLTVSTGLPANVSLRDSAGDVVSFGTFDDNETVTETVDLQTGDSFKPSFAANGADLVATVRYQEISHSANPAVTVNGNRTEYAGTLAPGETASLPANAEWLRPGRNTVAVELDTASTSDEPEPAVDLRYRHGAPSSPALSPATPSTPAGSETSPEPDDAATAVTTGDRGTPEPGATTAADAPGDGVVVTDVSFEKQEIRPSEEAVVLVTVQNPTDRPRTDTVELELFGQLVNSREVTVPAGGETTVRFVHNIVAPGTYTARVDTETATVRVRAPRSTTASTSSSSTSTTFPGFGPPVALVAAAVAALLFVRRD